MSGQIPELTPAQQYDRGCHCWGYSYGELQFRGNVITCPLHGIPFAALIANKSPQQIAAEREESLAKMPPLHRKDS